jgi:hypothetical protein
MAGKKEKMNQRSNRGAQIPHVGNLKPSHTNHTLVALIRIRLALFYFVAFSCCRRVRRSIPALSLRLNKPPWWFDVWCLKSAKFDASLLFWFSEGRQQVFRRSSAGRQQIVSRSSADRQQIVSRSSAGRQQIVSRSSEESISSEKLSETSISSANMSAKSNSSETLSEDCFSSISISEAFLAESRN